MKIIGIEFDSNKMNYVVIEKASDLYHVLNTGKIVLTGTRKREALSAFQGSVKNLFNSEVPDKIGIKVKPESGRLRAGAASMKMEGIVLANAPCEVDFVTGKRVNRSDACDDSLFGYLQIALKTAHASMVKPSD